MNVGDPPDSSDTAADELQAESELSYPVKTLRRLWLVVRNPLKAMMHVAYDPGLLIVPVMFLLFALFAFVQPYVILSKMEIPGEVPLYIPDPLNLTRKAYAEVVGKPYFTVSELKTEAQKLYWSSTLTFYVLSLALTYLVLLLSSRVIMGAFQYKVLLIGVTYSTLASLIIGLVWLGSSFLVPNVSVPYYSEGNFSYITWSAGSTSLVRAKVFVALTNFTPPSHADEVELWSARFSIYLTQSKVTTLLEELEFNGVSVGGRIVLRLPDGTARSLEQGAQIALSFPGVAFASRGGTTYLLASNGSMLELTQDSSVGFVFRLDANRDRSDKSVVGWVGESGGTVGGEAIEGGIVLVRPQQVLLNGTLLSPKEIAGNQTYNYWNLSVRVTGAIVQLSANLTATQVAQGDSGELRWNAESVLAQPRTAMMYFNNRMTEQTPLNFGVFVDYVLPAVAKAWQSVILICLIKSSYEDASWLRSIIVVAIQQGALLMLGF